MSPDSSPSDSTHRYDVVTIKALFSLSRGYCYAPNCRNQIIQMTSDNIPIVQVEIAHIRAAKKHGPRWDEDMDPGDRRAFANLLLLCLFHHKQVDRKPTGGNFSVEDLTEWKMQREGELGADLGGLTEDDLESLLADTVERVVTETKVELLEAIAEAESLGRQSVELLRALVAETFDRPYLNLEAVALLAESVEGLRHLPDTANLLYESSSRLGHLADSAPMLHESSQDLRNLPDYASMLIDAGTAIRSIPDYAPMLQDTVSELSRLMDRSSGSLEGSYRQATDLLGVTEGIERSSAQTSGLVRKVKVATSELLEASNDLAGNIAALQDAADRALQATEIRPPDRMTYFLRGMVIGAALVIIIVILFLVWPDSAAPPV